MSEQSRYVLVPEPPSVEEYLSIRRRSALSPKTRQQGIGAIRGSWSFCHIRSIADDSAVAMGRVIGDGGWYFHIADMATLPDHQGRGLGRRVLEHLLSEVRSRAPADPYVTLIADPPGRALYERAGFVDVAPGSHGMKLAESRRCDPRETAKHYI